MKALLFIWVPFIFGTEGGGEAVVEALEARPAGSPEGQRRLEKDFSFSYRLRAAQNLAQFLSDWHREQDR